MRNSCVKGKEVKCITVVVYTVKPVYKGHSREPEEVPFMSSCPLYTG